MKSAITVLRLAGAALVLLAAMQATPARADDGFPFGLEMTLDAARQPGSKRLSTLEIGDNGEVILELWCKGGKGQFSVAGNTVIFVAGPLQDMTGGRLDSAILRQLLIAVAMITIMLLRPRGLWPSPEHGKAAPAPALATANGKTNGTNGSASVDGDAPANDDASDDTSAVATAGETEE